MSLKLLIIAGARPNFMKVAPLIRAIQRHNPPVLPLRSPVSLADSAPLSHPMGEGSRVRASWEGAEGPGVRGEANGVERAGLMCSDASQPSTLNSQLTWRLVHTGQHYDAKM